MRFLARETHIMTSFANYVCDQNIPGIRLDSHEKFGSQSSCFQWHTTLVDSALLMMSLLLAASLMLLMLMVPGVVVAFHFFYCLYVTDHSLHQKSLLPSRATREFTTENIYNSPFWLSPSFSQSLQSSKSPPPSPLICHRKRCLGKISLCGVPPSVVFVEQRSYFLRYFISPNFRKLRCPLLLARPRRLLCVAFFFYDYFSLTYNSTINFCFHSCVFSFHFSTHRVFYDLPSFDSNFPKADERITIFFSLFPPFFLW